MERKDGFDKAIMLFLFKDSILSGKVFIASSALWALRLMLFSIYKWKFPLCLSELLFLRSETFVMGLCIKPSIALIVTLLVSHVSAKSLSVDSHDNILESAAILAEDVLTYHYDTDEPGLLSDDDYRFWQSSVLWTTLIDYRRLTSDEEHDDAVVKVSCHKGGATTTSYRQAKGTCSRPTTAYGDQRQCSQRRVAINRLLLRLECPPS
jgi:hypothetical protein